MRVPAERCSIALIAILVAATAVRFAGLGSKPLWIDEAMTVLVALGRGPDDVPLGVARPLTALASIFSLNPAATWLDVVTRLVDPAVQHTHPPLFYVLVHAWLAWLAPPLSELAFTLRAVAAVFGVVAVVLIFGLARSAFGERAGLTAAALAAVSPAMVMLAQEGRNYTLPLMLLSAAFWVMVAMVKRLTGVRSIPLTLWATWTTLNICACYAHDYSTLAFAAQALTLAILVARERSWPQLGWLAVSLTVAGVAFLPWLPILLKHSVSPEQGWMRLKTPGFIFVSTLDAWRAIFAGRGWEYASFPVLVTTEAVTIVFGAWMLLIAFVGLFTLGIVSLLLVAIGLPLAVGLVHGMRVVLVGKDGSAIAQLTRGAIDVALAGAITLMVGLAAVALFSNTETVCWRQHETAQGRWIEQMPASAESPVVTGSSGGATVFSFESGPVGGDVTAAGCDSGVVTPNGTLLEAGFLSGALALAMVVGSRSRPN